MLGTAYYMSLYYGPHSHARSNPFRGFLQIGYSYFASEIRSLERESHEDADRMTAFVALVFSIVLYLLITFTLVNLFISVVIMRYRFLRSMIQEKSTASFYIIKERVEIILDLLLYLLLFKKPKNLENDEQLNDPTQGDDLTF